MSHNRRGGDGVVGTGNKTSPCKTSVLNLGKSPQVPGLRVVNNEQQKDDAKEKGLLATRNERDSLPKNRRIMLLFSLAFIPEQRSAFRRRFQQASKDDKGEKSKCSSSNLCNIPISWIAKAQRRS